MKKDNKPANNNDRQDIDKAPGEERGKAEKVTKEDLKNKKVDADLSNKNEQTGQSNSKKNS